MGALLTYGSYLPKETKLPSAALTVVALDTGVAILAGLMILPAVFAFGFDPGAGPGLTFVTLPAVFASMPGGQFFGVLFFALLAVAALTSAISLLETVVCYFVDERAISRNKITVIASLISFSLAIPASLSLGVWSEFTVPGTSLSIFDFLDFTASSIMLPLGGLLTALFVGWKWGPQALIALQTTKDQSFALGPLWLFVLRFVAPLGIGWILLQAFI
jgi:NSS family neurotransmitter:Na+ symporter